MDLNLELYKKLYLVRKAEDKIKVHYTEDEMKTPMHMSMGGEAVSVGVISALAAEDQVTGTYRSHAIYLAKTLETDIFFAELFGKTGGTAEGKGGSMHLLSPESGLICTTAIVGTNIPFGVGAAYANKIAGNNKIVAIFFGDGAVDEGAFWESLNFASLKKLPVVFVYEDNAYAVHTPKKVRHGYNSITDIVSNFNYNVFHEDSTDVELIYNLTNEAIQAVRSTQNPSFIHFEYYRYLEHVGVFEDFDAGYRSRNEYEEWYKKDPIILQRNKLLSSYSADEIKGIEKEIDEQVIKSFELAKRAEFPHNDELYKNVFA